MNLFPEMEAKYALKLRAVAAIERAVLTRRDLIDQVCLAFERGELSANEDKDEAIGGLVVAIILNLDTTADQEAVAWFVRSLSAREMVSLVTAGIVAVDVRLGTEGRACIWRNAVKGRRSAIASEEGIGERMAADED